MTDSKNDNLLPTNRIEALTDGIFAITMTIMILDLKTPENIPYDLATKELPQILENLLPNIEAYAISFIVLGIFWLRHQLQFKYIKSANKTLLGFTVIFLMMIGFVPFSVGFMMRYNDAQLPFVIYVSNLLAISVIMTTQWRYASHNYRLIEKEISPELIKRFSLLSMAPITIFSLSILTSFIDVRMAFIVIYCDPIFYAFYRMFRKKNSISL